MILYFAPRSPFAIKVRIVIHELGLGDAVRLVATDPWSDDALRALNPLCKVPTLVLEDGVVVYDSPVICEVLNERAGGDIVPSSGARRLEALRLQALSDGLSEAVIRRFVERLGPVNERSDRVAVRQDRVIESVLDALDAGPSLRELSSVGEIATAAALVYLSFRSPEIAWREGRPKLARWYAEIQPRLSMAATRIAGPAAT